MYLNYRLPDIPVNPIPYPDFFLLTNMCILRCIADSEKEIMRAPEQYLWIHRRFKTRPVGESSLYI